MKLLLIGAVASALVQLISADVCAIATLAKVLTNQYIDQCADDSGYVFTSGAQPTPEEVAGMCASDACHSLLADVVAMNLTECTLPIGSGIYLFADLIDYVSDQCAADTPEPTTATPEPTPSPTTVAPTPTTATPAPTTAIASCTSAQLRYLLTSTYEAQCVADTAYSFTSPYSPTDAQVAAMCASESCVSLFTYVSSMVTTDCRIPVGGKILLLADLVDYVSDQCVAETPAPTTAAPTPEPTTATLTPTTATPAPTTAVASCTSAQLRYLLTSTYEAQCVADTAYSFTSPYSPTDAQVVAMCASESCVNLFNYVSSMVTTDCRIPVGGKILLLADLVDYVSDQCTADTPEPTTATPTPEPTTATPVPTTTTPTPTTTTPVTTCTTPVLTSLLTDTYIDQCADDSGYSFTSGVQPTAEEVTGMCASSACANLLADVEAMGLSECILPIGNKIYLFRDLIDYVSDQCGGSSGSSTKTPATTAPTTESPITESPGTDAPGTESPSTPTPSSDSPATSTPGTESPITTMPGTESPTTVPGTDTPTTESPTTDTPTTETPEPTSPTHDAC